MAYLAALHRWGRTVHRLDCLPAMFTRAYRRRFGLVPGDDRKARFARLGGPAIPVN